MRCSCRALLVGSVVAGALAVTGVLVPGNAAAADRPPHSPNSYFIPAAANVAGVGGTYWTTEVIITNVDDTEKTLDLFYTPREADGTDDYEDATVTIPACTTQSWTDVLGTVFGEDGAGSLEVRGTNIIVTSRTSTPGPQGGSYGQGIPSATPELLIRGDVAAIQRGGGAVRSAQYRSNLGFCEVWGEEVSLHVSLYSGGALAGTTNVDIPAYGNTQINDVPQRIAGLNAMEDGLIEISVVSGEGRVMAYLSIVDNVTGDPTYIAIGVAPSSTSP